MKLGFLLFGMLFSVLPAPAQQKIAAPRIWNDRDLAEWATPLALPKVRPGHLSEKEYYAVPVGEWVRTYPVYFPGREPAGYWEMLQRAKPEPLIEPGARSESDWIAAGRRVFRELDVPAFRTKDPKTIAKIRSAEEFAKLGGQPQPDGTVIGWRWAPTSAGLMLSVSECVGCHVRYLPDGTRVDGAQSNSADDLFFEVLQQANEVFLPGDSQALATWRQFTVPWLKNDIHDRIKTMTWKQILDLTKSNPPGTVARINGSPWHPTPIVDLNGVKDRKYLDYNATHRNRGVEDIARYAVLVACCDSQDFGGHQILLKEQRIPPYRVTDDLAFAVAKYIYSLEAPRNPNAIAAGPLEAGKRIFDREGCAGCHPAPAYTNNKLTLVEGWKPPKDHPYRGDMLLMSVGTEPDAGLKTRKGTGLYKVPSLRGLWYRTYLSHDSSVASLEEWFDPARLRRDYVPKGFRGYQVERRAVPGHTYGMQLGTEDKAALIAFLRTL